MAAAWGAVSTIFLEYCFRKIDILLTPSFHILLLFCILESESTNNYNNSSSHKKGLREQWLTTLEASKTDIAALAVVGGRSKRPNKRTPLALGALVWIVGVSCDLAHAIEGERLL